MASCPRITRRALTPPLFDGALLIRCEVTFFYTVLWPREHVQVLAAVFPGGSRDLLTAARDSIM
ncbi:hypothetical protein MANAM107_10560 [Actinomyces capricornis]|uniref:Uncharacterized protein n=1 Tax=Actinomyces capricornis TaxID=2755559 RepID=A0ABN6K4U4_9ACTO|nr:hypothetical protein MANAM107_10560 [Actinomyces capricornis]